MKKKLITQIDPRWRDCVRYDGPAADALQGLDDILLAYLERPTPEGKAAALKAEGKLSRAIRAMIERGGMLRGKGSYSIYDYGCWDCCVCMVAADFSAKLFEYQKDTPLVPTPPNLIKVLHSWQIITPIAYLDEVVIDPVSVVTRGAVQLVLHEDYGASGAPVSRSRLLSFALEHREYVRIVAAVWGHPFGGKKSGTHWVVIDGDDGISISKLMMRDPSVGSPVHFNFRKLYTLCIYSTRSHIGRIFDGLADHYANHSTE